MRWSDGDERVHTARKLQGWKDDKEAEDEADEGGNV